MDAVEEKDAGGECRVEVAEFDHSAKSFLSTVDAIEALCRDSAAEHSPNASEIAWFSSIVTFLREWTGFCYDTKVADFICDTRDGQTKELAEGIQLPQFSAAAVPKMEETPEKKMCSNSDFILHAGGLVWALDWCPQIRKSDCQIHTEYLAVAAHPPGATYHKIGTLLKGRGVVQIWCVLTLDDKNDVSSLRKKIKKNTGAEEGIRSRGRPRKNFSTGEVVTTPRPRGRPRKSQATPNSEDDVRSDSTIARFGKKVLLMASDINGSMDMPPKRSRGRPKKIGTTSGNDIPGSSSKRPRGRPRKHPLPDTTYFNQTQDINSCGTQEILSTIPFVEPISVDSTGCDNVTGSSSRKPRGRPRSHKHPVPSIMNINGEPDINQNLILQNDTSIEPLLKRNSLLDVSDLSGKRYSLCNEYQTPGAGANIVPSHVDAGNNVLVSPGSVFENCKKEAIVVSQKMENAPCSNEESSVSKCNGRRRKESVPNMCDLTFSGKDDLPPCGENQILNGDGNVVSPSVVAPSNGLVVPTLGSDDELILPLCKRRPRKKTIPPSVVAPDNGLVVTTVDSDDELILPLCKRSSRKKLVPSLDKFSPTIGVASGHNAPPLVTSGDRTLHTDAIAGGSEIGGVKMTSHFIPNGLALPRVVLCLAHNGKVAWDVKWRPSTAIVNQKHHMGYLAVLLGDGSLEVWDVPLPSTVKTLYNSKCAEGTGEDPRFVKLEPIFRCSKVKCGDRLSFPMTVEWSPFPCDLILAGCHDGTVAIWKFSTEFSSQDTKPLLRFSADSVPIRALAWAPKRSDAGDNTLFVTAGHEGIKFWDIRDPYRPLWELNPVQRAVLSIDWVKDPRCIIMSFDDGTLRILSLQDAAYDGPITTELSVRRRSHSLHVLACSSFAIWCIHVSQYTGFASYCTADGLAVHFPLTSKSVDKNRQRNRMPHFLCGSLLEKDQRLNINSGLSTLPLANVPFSLKKTSTNCRDDAQTNQHATFEMGLTDESFHATPDMKVASTYGTSEKQSDDGKFLSQDFLTTQNEEMKPEGTTDKVEKNEDFPPKIVAMHSVRWNMNKGSSSWLCYGGAAGIIRCQKIS